MLADLKRAGLKLTPQRIAIARELEGDESHPTAQELYERLLPAFPTMSFQTVYNTLETLGACGMIRTIKLGASTRFDPNTSSHHHAVCDECGVIIDIPAEPPPQKAHGFRVRTEERTYRGTCGRCSKE